MVKNHLDVTQISPAMLVVINGANFTKWTRSQYISAGEEASKIKYFSQWILGKLANEYSKKWGDCSAYAREIHIESRSLLAYRRVYRKIIEADPNYVPDGFLTWGSIQIIAEQEKPIKLIEELSSKGKVTIKETIQYIATKGGKPSRPAKPKISLKYDEESGLWELDMDREDFEKIKWEKVGQDLLRYLKELWEG